MNLLTNFDRNIKLKVRSLLPKEAIFFLLLNVQRECSFFHSFFLQELEDPKTSLTEKVPIPLNEYRRNKLMRLSEMLGNKRSKFENDLEES